jgi:hypothetical protein
MTKKVWILHHATGINDYENVRLLECFDRNGFEGQVLEPKYFDIIVSRSTSKSIRYKGEKIDMPDLVLSRTGAGTNYFTLTVMRQIEKFGIPVINDADSISKVSDKLLTSQLLVRENLPIPKTKKLPSLYDCFDLYVEGEVLEGESSWYNEETKEKQDVIKKINFWSFPSILAIDLKRFNNKSVKNQILVDFPIDSLDLSKYVIGYKKESYIYDLYAICNHSGSSSGGHYTSFVKNANNKWYHFNDTTVTEMDLDKLISPKAYCLFYRKKTIP